MLPAVLLSIFGSFSQKVTASINPGIIATVYNNFGYNDSPPLPSVSGRPIAGTTEFQDINQNFDANPPFGLTEDFIVKYEGHITSPITGNITFWPHADDGTMFYLDGILIDEGNWVDKGGGGNQSEPQEFIGGVSKPFTYWYYENGGGANTALYWNIGNGWEIVPVSAFTKDAVNTPVTTTTTLAPYFNPVTNLIAIAKPDGGVDINWNTPELSNLEIYAYTVSFYKLEDGVESGGWGVWTEQPPYNLGPWMWTGTTGYGEVRFKIRPGTIGCFTLSNFECFYGPEEYVDVFLIDPTPTTTTTSSTTTSTTTSTSTTTTSSTSTTVFIPETTLPTTTTTTVFIPETTLPTTTTENTVARTTIPQETQTTLLQQTEQPQTTTTTNAPPIITEDKTVFDSLTQTEIIQSVNSILQQEISKEQATELATNAKVIENINIEQAAEIFSAIEISSITEEQAEQIIEAVQNAPEEIRESFEEEINVFDGAIDTYVPLGSTVDIQTRRVLIAATTIAASISITPPSSSGSSSSSSSGSGGSGDSGKPSRRKN
jgi:hypothetical protein